MQAQQTRAFCAPRRSNTNTLDGRNIFQLRAAVQEPQVTSAKAPAPAPEPVVELPTSDESEELLRIRHSVSGCDVLVCAGVQRSAQNCSVVWGAPHVTSVFLMQCCPAQVVMRTQRF